MAVLPPIGTHYNPDQPRAPKGSEEGGQWVGKSADPHLAPISYETLSDDQQRAVLAYSGNSHDVINEYLRENEGELSEKQREWVPSFIDEIDASMRPMPIQAVVYRGVFGDWGRNLKVGDVIQDKGFTSTTTAYSVAEGFTDDGGDNEIFEIKVPKGTRAVWLGGRYGQHEGESDEHELLLSRGGRYRYMGRGRRKNGDEVHKLLRLPDE